MFCDHGDYDDYFERCNDCGLDKEAICNLENICFNCGLGIFNEYEHNGRIYCSQECVNKTIEMEQ